MANIKIDVNQNVIFTQSDVENLENKIMEDVRASIDRHISELLQAKLAANGNGVNMGTADNAALMQAKRSRIKRADEDWIFYVNDADWGTLWKIRKDGRDNQLVYNATVTDLAFRDGSRGNYIVIISDDKKIWFNLVSHKFE